MVGDSLRYVITLYTEVLRSSIAGPGIVEKTKQVEKPERLASGACNELGLAPIRLLSSFDPSKLDTKMPFTFIQITDRILKMLEVNHLTQF